MSVTDSPKEEQQANGIDFEDLMRKYDTEARFRLAEGWQKIAISLTAVAMACFHFWTAGFGLLNVQQQGAVHMAFALTLTLMLYPATDKANGEKMPLSNFLLPAFGIAVAVYAVTSLFDLMGQTDEPVAPHILVAVGLAVVMAAALAFPVVAHFLGKKASPTKVPFYDFALSAVAILTSLYVVIFYMELTERAGLPTITDLIIGSLFIVLVLEATRRISNPVLPAIAILSLLYCYAGPYLPEAMAHRGFSFERIINHMYLGVEGLFGTPLQVSSTFVFIFILFGAVLEKTGIGRFIIDLSLALAGWSTGGPAKVAVVASGLMGTVSGSSVANVCTTGMFTIPLMKSVGYRPHFAGAVEAVASTGGQIMPPIMGSGAFILAQFLGISYIEVAIAAIVPALLYYVSVIVQVHFEAQRLGLVGLPKDRLPHVWTLLRTKGFLLIPLVAIVYFLLAGYTPLKSAFYGILVCIPLSYLNKETALTPKKLYESFESGARGALAVACACACVGMIVGMGTLTGAALRIANGIIALSGGMLLPTMILTMLASIALGTGLPTTANFIVTSTMAAPALLQLGVPPMAAYMFVFYFGIAADLTPPVALAAYAGAGIAGADPMKTGITAFKLALAGLIVPYIYVFNPVLLQIGIDSPVQMILPICTALLGVTLLAMATIGYFRTNMNLFMRAVALVGALGLLDPGTLTDMIGFAILAFVVIVQTFKKRSQAQVR